MFSIGFLIPDYIVAYTEALHSTRNRMMEQVLIYESKDACTS